MLKSCIITDIFALFAEQKRYKFGPWIVVIPGLKWGKIKISRGI